MHRHSEQPALSPSALLRINFVEGTDWTLDKPGEAARNQVFEPFVPKMCTIAGIFDAPGRHF